MSFKCYISAIVLLMCSSLNSQSRLHVKAFRYDSAVLLRWYPQDYATWMSLLEKPVVIYRKEAYRTSATQELVSPEITLDTGVQFKKLIAGKPAAGIILEAIRQGALDATGIAEIRQKQASEQTALLYSFLLLQKDFELSQQLGVAFMDRNIDPQKTYIYYIKCHADVLKDSLVIIPKTYENTQAFGKPEIVSRQPQVVLAWNTEMADETVAAVHLQRSIDTGKTWNYVSTEPVFKDINIGESNGTKIITDDMGNYPTVWYRWIPINYFGFELPAGEFVECAAGATVPSPEILVSEQANVLQWKFDIESEKEVAGFKVFQADSIMGNYTPVDDSLYAPAVRSAPFIQTEGTKYVIVAALDREGGQYWSDPVLFQSIDSFAPEMPAGLYGNIDSLGRVSIHWPDSEEKDLLGYMVYTSNNRTAEFAPSWPRWMEDTLFHDSLDLGWMRDSVYYRVVASDNRYNESKASAILALAVPASFIPDAPRILRAFDSGQAVHLYFAGSTNRQVHEYHVLRIENGDTQLLDKLPSSRHYYCDREVRVGKDYEYSVRAVTKQKKQSKPSPYWHINVQEPLYLPAIEGMELWLDSTKQRYYLSWKKPNYTVKHYRIIHLVQGKPQTIMTVEGGALEVKLPANQTYVMKNIIIVAYDAEGRSSSW